MSRDLIVGGASNYTWEELKYWINSIRKSGFTGDVAIVGTNLKKETIDKLTSEGVILSLYGKKNERGDFEAHANGAPHVERFFYMWHFLNEIDTTKYERVITTDTRDVVFQDNPSNWLVKNASMYPLVISGEGLRYKNEPWGNQNLLSTFGPYFHDKLKNNHIYNVGVIAGDIPVVRDLMLLIFQLSVNRPIEIVDQAVFNFIIQLDQFSMEAFKTHNEDSWACQLGTTEEAVKAGAGDLGMICSQDPDKMRQYLMDYESKQPKFLEDGTVTNADGEPYAIVHQYDRIPKLKKLVEKKYGTV